MKWAINCCCLATRSASTSLLLADSRYRHQVEADIEPFRGLLLSGMCVPDLRGSQGTFSFFSTASGDAGQAAFTGGEQTVLELSQEEIGLLTGLSRQRVNQAMRHLAELGLVEISYQSIRVVDLDGLRAFGMASL